MRDEEVIVLGKWTGELVSEIIHESASIKGAGERIAFLSERFIGTKYKEETLIGGLDTAEVFVINLDAMDCFTFIEYVEAMRCSASYTEFKTNLATVRYRSGKVAFECRNHFFTDWKLYNAGHIDDATRLIGGRNTGQCLKTLNKKKGRGLFLPGIPISEREVYYIPARYIDGDIMSRLKTGDYIGIYSEDSGLDVSHAGILVRDGVNTVLRHASSSPELRKVVDQDFLGYVSARPGIIVLRPK